MKMPIAQSNYQFISLSVTYITLDQLYFIRFDPATESPRVLACREQDVMRSNCGLRQSHSEVKRLQVHKNEHRGVRDETA